MPSTYDWKFSRVFGLCISYKLQRLDWMLVRCFYHLGRTAVHTSFYQEAPVVHLCFCDAEPWWASHPHLASVQKASQEELTGRFLSSYTPKHTQHYQQWLFSCYKTPVSVFLFLNILNIFFHISCFNCYCYHKAAQKMFFFFLKTQYCIGIWISTGISGSVVSDVGFIFATGSFNGWNSLAPKDLSKLPKTFKVHFLMDGEVN